jgi:hypothetical protein
MRALLALLSLSTQSLEPQLQHGGNVFWQAQGWTVYSYPDEEQCDLAVEYKNGEMLTLGYRAKDQSVGVVATNRHATSLAHDKVVNLDIHFFSNGKLLRTWTQINFTAKAMPEAGRVLVSEPIDAKFLEDFAQADLFAILTRGNIVTGSALKGSEAAKRMLVQCGRQVAVVDPLDPFLK